MGLSDEAGPADNHKNFDAVSTRPVDWTEFLAGQNRFLQSANLKAEAILTMH
jgi:hypothetical protein